MLTVITVTAFLFMCLRCCSVNAQRVGACVDSLKAASINETSACDITKNFTKCFLGEIQKHNLNYSNKTLQALKSFLQVELNKTGVKCKRDIAALIEEVIEEEELGVEHVTAPLKGCCSENVQRAGACADSVQAASINETSACDVMKNFTKCFLRETQMHTLNSSDEKLQELKSFLQEELNKIGVKCEIDIAALTEEVREEEEHVTSPSKGYKESTTIGECFDSLGAEISKQGANCRLLPPYIKCKIRVLNIYKLTFNNTDEYTKLGVSLKQGLDKISIDCDIDYQGLIEEVRQEQAQMNSASFVDFTFHSIVLLAFVFISFVFH